MKNIVEDTYEQALIEKFQELGYEYLYGPEVENDERSATKYSNVVGDPKR